MPALFNRFFIESPSESLSNFNMGFVAGVLVFFVLALLTRLIFFLFFSNMNRSSGITINALKGKIFISSGAVSDIVKISASAFHEVRIEKIFLMKEKELLYIDIFISIMNSKDPLTGVIELLQNRVLETLNERLGINSVRTVNVKVKKVVSSIE